MADPLVYAQLADVIYQDIRGDSNRTSIPQGWAQLFYTSAMEAGLLGRLPNSGFSAGVYQNGAEMVIALVDQKGSGCPLFSVNRQPPKRGGRHPRG